MAGCCVELMPEEKEEVMAFVVAVEECPCLCESGVVDGLTELPVAVAEGTWFRVVLPAGDRDG